jgi:hypothetical protein
MGRKEALAGLAPPSYLEHEDVTPRMVGRFFRAAARFYLARPWERLEPPYAMLLDVPAAFASGWYLQLAEGEYPGFMMVETRGDLERAWQMHDDVPFAGKDERGPLMTLVMVPGSDLPGGLRREVASHGWEVADAQAYPVVSHADPYSGEVRSPSPHQLAQFTAAAEVLAHFFANRRKPVTSPFRDMITVPDMERPTTARLVCPHPGLDPPETSTYDPELGPDLDAWLDLDQDGQLADIERYHEERPHGMMLGRPDIHAMMHWSAEFELMHGNQTSSDACERILLQGLTRHDAIHQIGAVLLEAAADLVDGGTLKTSPSKAFDALGRGKASGPMARGRKGRGRKKPGR